MTNIYYICIVDCTKEGAGLVHATYGMDEIQEAYEFLRAYGPGELAIKILKWETELAQ